MIKYIAKRIIIAPILLPKENVMETIHKKLGSKRPELNPINDKAFMAGYELGKAARESKIQ